MDKMLTPKDVGQKLGISRNTTYKLIALEGFPKIKIGHKYFIPETKFENFIMCHNKKSNSIEIRFIEINRLSENNDIFLIYYAIC